MCAGPSLMAVSPALHRPPSAQTGLPAWTGALLRGIAGVALLGAVWELSVLLLQIKPHYLPKLSAVLSAVAATPRAYVDGIVRTAIETLLGFASGTLFGVAVAIVFFRARILRDLFFPIFVVSQTIPVIAFGALIVLWFGNTLFAKAVMAFYLTFFPVTVNTLLGLQSADPRQEALLRSFGASGTQLLWKLQLPGALPQIFVALRLAASLSLIGAIVGEWFGDTVGIGVMILQATYTENTVGIWGALLAAALLGTVFYGCVAWAERRIVFWSAEQ